LLSQVYEFFPRGKGGQYSSELGAPPPSTFLGSLVQRGPRRVREGSCLIVLLSHFSLSNAGMELPLSSPTDPFSLFPDHGDVSGRTCLSLFPFHLYFVVMEMAADFPFLGSAVFPYSVHPLLENFFLDFAPPRRYLRGQVPRTLFLAGASCPFLLTSLITVSFAAPPLPMTGTFDPSGCPCLRIRAEFFFYSSCTLPVVFPWNGRM